MTADLIKHYGQKDINYELKHYFMSVIKKILSILLWIVYANLIFMKIISIRFQNNFEHMKVAVDYETITCF